MNLWPTGGTRGMVMGSPKSVGFMMKYVQDVLAIHLIVVEILL